MPSPIRLLVHGASGRMGQAVLRLAEADPRFVVVCAVSRSGADIPGCSVPVHSAATIADCPAFDVAIDFSLPGGFETLLASCIQRGAALVSGTTGLDAPAHDRLAGAARSIPVLWASNFSVGIVVLEELVRRAAIALGDWTVEITETHHAHKKDAPSGTALSLAAAIAGAAGALPPIHSVRQGEVVGEHTIRLSGPGETLEFMHRAEDRDIFARGALEAAVGLHGAHAGRWSLRDIVFGQALTD